MPDLGNASQLPYLGRDEIFATLGYTDAAKALERALDDGLEPDRDPPRTTIDVGAGHLLVMPSAYLNTPVTKLATVGGTPRIQGICVVFDPGTLRPAALLDGVGLTLLRTAALSGLAAARLVRHPPRNLVVFGSGPQAQAHAQVMSDLFPIAHTRMIGREGHPDLAAVLAEADLICCCTTSATALFNGSLVPADATVVAIGSHEPDKRELDERLMARATVVVESRASALAEAGDVVMAVSGGSVSPASLVTISDLVRASPTFPAGPKVFKSTGMSWEDAVVATAVCTRAGLLPQSD